MPKYTGQQLSTLSTVSKEIQKELEFLHDFVFGFNDGEIIIYDPVPEPCPPEEKCFKPQNNQLRADANYWGREFDRLERIVQSSQSTEIISLADSNKFIYVSSKFNNWCRSVILNYLTEDIPAYRNITSDLSTSSTRIILEPTVSLTPFSTTCSFFAPGALRIHTVTGFFKPQKYQDNLNELAIKSQTINSILNNPTIDPTTPVVPIQLSQTGTNKLLSRLGEIFSYIKESFRSVFEDLASLQVVAGTIALSLHDMRSVELKSARETLQDLRGNPEFPTVSTQQLKSILDRHESAIFVGSDGNYYPIPMEYFREELDSNGLPLDPLSGNPINIVRLSTTNGILSSLRRLDDNAQSRYQRINDVLYEVNVGISEIRPTVKSVSDEIRTLQQDVLELKNAIASLKIVIDSINSRI